MADHNHKEIRVAIEDRLTLKSFVSCGPTAVGAVTGADEDSVCAAIREAAKEDGEHPAHLKDCSFPHQCRAVELLGYELRTLDGIKIDARSLPRKYVVDQNSPTVDEFVRGNESDEVLLCLAGGQRPGQPKPEAHSFAVDRKRYFDNNTVGESVPANDIRRDLAMFRVVKVLAVPRTKSDVDESE
jgi:hypothetical protein